MLRCRRSNLLGWRLQLPGPRLLLQAHAREENGMSQTVCRRVRSAAFRRPETRCAGMQTSLMRAAAGRM